MSLAIANQGLGKAQKRQLAAQVWATLGEANAQLATGSYYHIEGEPRAFLSPRWPT
jgi:hypothetical protein